MTADAHKVYDLEAIDDTTVAIMCADCREPLGLATVMDWGLIAETHYREKVTDGQRPA